MADSLEKKFENIGLGVYCGHFLQGDYVVKDEQQWSNLWGKVNSINIPQLALPLIDFNNDMVIAVFLGTKRTGGYSIKISGIKETDDCLEVSVVETAPGGRVTMALTQPYHLIKTSLTDKEVKFIR